MNEKSYKLIQVFPNKNPVVLKDNLTKQESERLETQLSKEQPLDFFVSV